MHVEDYDINGKPNCQYCAEYGDNWVEMVLCPDRQKPQPQLRWVVWSYADQPEQVMVDVLSASKEEVAIRKVENSRNGLVTVDNQAVLLDDYVKTLQAIQAESDEEIEKGWQKIK